MRGRRATHNLDHLGPDGLLERRATVEAVGVSFGIVVIAASRTTAPVAHTVAALLGRFFEDLCDLEAVPHYGSHWEGAHTLGGAHLAGFGSLTGRLDGRRPGRRRLSPFLVHRGQPDGGAFLHHRRFRGGGSRQTLLWAARCRPIEVEWRILFPVGH